VRSEVSEILDQTTLAAALSGTPAILLEERISETVDER
jgi:hypothetical protein